MGAPIGGAGRRAHLFHQRPWRDEKTRARLLKKHVAPGRAASGLNIGVQLPKVERVKASVGL
jgi:hypothetical protein